MMRSLFSCVAGLKVHQTRMDVIGNNIANVNTTSYKSQSMVFSDLLYQTTQAASGANAATGRGGINARQIGLGAKTGAISTAITTQGSAQSTNNPFDIMITGESFFVVSNGSENFFTRDGSFTVDGAGNLVMTSTGYTVMGWQTNDLGEIVPDTVSALQVMNADNLTYPPESTTAAYVSGILDKYDPNTTSSQGKIISLSFFAAASAFSVSVSENMLSSLMHALFAPRAISSAPLPKVKSISTPARAAYSPTSKCIFTLSRPSSRISPRKATLRPAP